MIVFSNVLITSDSAFCEKRGCARSREFRGRTRRAEYVCRLAYTQEVNVCTQSYLPTCTGITSFECCWWWWEPFGEFGVEGMDDIDGIGLISL